MIDREKLETILRRRFPGSSLDQVAAAANAIIGLDSQEPENRHGADGGSTCHSGRNAGDAPMAPGLPSAPA
jgi:hypothetical protein